MHVEYFASDPKVRVRLWKIDDFSRRAGPDCARRRANLQVIVSVLENNPGVEGESVNTTAFFADDRPVEIREPCGPSPAAFPCAGLFSLPFRQSSNPDRVARKAPAGHRKHRFRTGVCHTSGHAELGLSFGAEVLCSRIPWRLSQVARPAFHAYRIAYSLRVTISHQTWSSSGRSMKRSCRLMTSKPALRTSVSTKSRRSS